MTQGQAKFPGFGVVYPGGGERGIKVVRTFTDGPRKTINPDGSISYESPPPNIHELFGGGFCYADGKPVSKREHLERITELGMKQRALEWFDSNGVVKEDVVIKKEEVIPTPSYVVSNQVPKEVLETGQGVIDEEKTVAAQTPSDPLNQILQAINSLADRVGKLESIPEEKKRAAGDRRIRQRDAMKAKWQDPEYVKNVMESRKKTKEVNKDERSDGSVPDEGGSTR